jgi:membrane protein required for colicin V production
MQNTGINPTDIVVIVILLLSALLAFARGLVREVLSVGAWVGAAFATLMAFPHMVTLTQSLVRTEVMAKLLAGGSVFLATLVILSILSHQLSKRVRDSALSAIDRSLGFVFGIVRGGVLVCLAYLLVAWVFPPAEQPVWLRDARTMPVIQSGANVLRRLVPDADRNSAAVQEAAVPREKATPPVPEEALRPLSTPRPAATNAGASESTPGYKDRDRSELNRLFETSN